MKLPNGLESFRFVEQGKVAFYQSMALQYQKYPVLTRVFGGLQAAGVSIVTTPISRVCHVAETVFIGFANIFGVPFSKQCYFIRGVKIIFIGIPLSLFLLAITSIEVPISALASLVFISIFPREWIDAKSEFHSKCLRES